MLFSTNWYIDLLNAFIENNYSFIFFGEEDKGDSKQIILRHDVDISLEKALELAKIENRLGVKSTFFILLGTSFYNPLLRKDKLIIQNIQELGHEIGLHFDTKNYDKCSLDELINNIEKEMTVLSYICNKKINKISFHRPISEFLNKTISSNIISAYEKRYFQDFSYISDSRYKWKKDPYNLIDEDIKKIQCLIHPIWYSNNGDKPFTIFSEFETNKRNEIKEALQLNISNFSNLLENEEV